MRPILYGDVREAALLLLDVPEDARAGRLRRMLVQADAADDYRKRVGRLHPLWGNGSLMAVAGQSHRSEPFMDDPAYCACLALVFETLVAWRAEKANLSRKHN